MEKAIKYLKNRLEFEEKAQVDLCKIGDRKGGVKHLENADSIIYVLELLERYNKP